MRVAIEVRRACGFQCRTARGVDGAAARVRRPTMPRMTYGQTRRMILAAGLGLLLVTAGVMYVRRVDTVEVLAVLLFIPVFLAFVTWDVVGGVVAGALAAVAYAALRAPAMEAVGGGRFVSLILSRTIAYLAFGILGGWADRQLQRSLTKLDLYDQIDDLTGLYNSRFLLQATDLEMARAVRYKTLFSVCVVDVPVGPIDAVGRRKRNAVLAELGRLLKDSVRTVDRAVFGHDDHYRFAVVCPETGPEGARIFASRMAERVAGVLRDRGVSLDGPLASAAYTYPSDDDSGLHQLREEFTAIERAQHPEHPAAPTEAPAPRPGG